MSARHEHQGICRTEVVMKVKASLFALALALPAAARAEGPETREYSRTGEVSPGTQAPSVDALMDAIEHGSPERLKATLEYGERVLCERCVPALYGKLLTTDNSRVRELSAWWLRRQPLAGPLVIAKLRTAVKAEKEAVRRARAAEALGEMMDPGSLPQLSDAALEDADASVRAAGVRALARLNSAGAAAVLGDVLADKDANVRLTALDVLIIVGGFREYELLLPLLGDTNADVRARAARLCGEHRVGGAETALIAMLRGDEAVSARKAAAWALGRIGHEAGISALIAAEKSEKNEQVLDAIDVAGRMPGRD